MLETPHPIAITAGEPAGIGPDLCIQLAQNPRDYPLVIISNIELLHQRAAQLKLDLDIIPYCKGQNPTTQARALCVLDIPLDTPVEAQKLDIKNAKHVIESLTEAAKRCMTNEFSALVTGPVQKSVINDAGINFSGHTEFFAEMSNTPKVVMMLATQALKVALVTTHLPLSQVAAAINKENVEQTLLILNTSLKENFGIQQPRIFICGLNPHAGENGHLGKEEQTIITPVIEKLKHQGLCLTGPLPADTVFTPKYLDNADVIVAMYHDQGLPVLKHQGFGSAANITLGLPFIRTSVDHGTALDLAGTGQADLGSLYTAIHYATLISQTRKLSAVN